jgi:imidazole glycerol-phosphate synthase subunit HisH
MISIVDYGLGNILAFVNVYKRLNIPFAIARTAAELQLAERVLLPGVGAFDHAMERLSQSGMRETLDHLVQSRGVPVLGICVGMQILAESSEEGSLPGLGWIRGRVRKFDPATLRQPTRLPHMGWNDARPTAESGLFNGLESESRFYFLHSYYLDCEDPADVAAVTHYGIQFSCAVQRRNVYGVQFHPEKSHHFGTQVLKNFAELP